MNIIVISLERAKERRESIKAQLNALNIDAIIMDAVDGKDLSDEQKQEYNDRLENFYNEIIGKPFAEGQVEGAVKKGIKDLDISIDKVVRDHYTVYDATKRTLQEKLIDELGIDGDNAKMIAVCNRT